MFRIQFNYAISLELPNNEEVRDFHFISRELLDSEHVESEIISRQDNKSITRQAYYKDEYLYTLGKVLVDTETGIAFLDTTNPKAVLESSNILPIEISDYLRPRTTGRIDEGLWVCLPSRSFAHWLLQDLPRFYRLIELHPELQVATMRNPPRYVTSLLKALDISPNVRKPVIYPEFYRFIGTQYAVGVPSTRDLLVLKNLGDKLIEQVRIDTEHPRRVYISRSKSSRPLLNEEYIENSLRIIGFEILYLEETDFVEQIRLFKNCELIVGAHGAGLANIVWCGADAKVIEIFDSNFQQESILTVSVKLGINYIRVPREKFDDHLLGGYFD